MKAWEYKVHQIMIPVSDQSGKKLDKHPPTEDQFNALGNEGWELVHLQQVMLPAEGQPIIGKQQIPRPCLHCIFKREKSRIVVDPLNIAGEDAAVEALRRKG